MHRHRVSHGTLHKSRIEDAANDRGAIHFEHSRSQAFAATIRILARLNPRDRLADADCKGRIVPIASKGDRGAWASEPPRRQQE